ncbi:PREDICTED: LOW QUALITY PROTEIN: furin-like [Branchiostoma belcheri]|uniref:LOW QUALITY PROTEIN: furin-like n=1 Tax=Branchiostoma belcheri TaxID=7741 RepID=A0A6P4XCC6_BRABE|nr:PREDICTED: LOW QUALITY PROTEIN: furin-like [Branchiostoma belcheri]
MARIRHVISTVLLLAWVSMVIARDPVYSNEWAVQVVGGQQEAVRLADKHGFTYGGKIFGDYHLFRHSHVSRRSTSASHQKHHGLLQENSVSWVEQQVWKERVPRSGRVTLNVCLNDPDWPKQEWYMNNCAGLDMHVTGAWLRGYLGEGVNVAVVDDGLQTDHPDLNYDATLSTDVVDGDRDPSHPADSTGHGTKVAGVATAIANNSLCGVGVAPQARVGGIRLLDAALTSDVNDAQDAQAYTFGQDSVDVYVSSWGPNDFGEVDGPGTPAQTALRNGATTGRGGKGNVYIFSSGNGGGGQYPDSCAFDGFVNNPYSLAFGSVSGTGRRAAHSEACSALIACVYAEDRNNPNGNKMVTTKTTSECTDDFFQSSAGAPIAGGILALALNANGALTWRDLKHLIVQTSQPDVRLTSSDANDWTTNAAGHRVSSYFGFGLLDASRLVDAARTWTTVPALQTCEMVHTHTAPGLHIPQTGNLTLTVDYSSRSCAGVNIRFLEAAVLTLDYNFYPRGHLEATLTSPLGTRSLMLRRREVDIIPGPPVVDQDFMSVQFWGENPTGTWTFQLRNYYPSTAGNGTLNKWTLTLYGTETDPMGGNSLPATPGTTCVSDCSNASLVLPTPAATLLSSTLLASTVVGAASGGSSLTGGNMLGILVASVYLIL